MYNYSCFDNWQETTLKNYRIVFSEYHTTFTKEKGLKNFKLEEVGPE